MECPERLDALVTRFGLIGEEVCDGGVVCLAFDEEAERVHADVLCGVGERVGEGGVVGFGELGDGVAFPFAVHDAPDACEVVVAVWANGGVDAVVIGAACIVVDGGLVIEIDDVKGAIGTDADFDGSEPEVFGGDEFCFFATWFFCGGVAESVWGEEGVVDDVDGGFGDEVAVVPFGGPSASVIDGCACGGGEGADPIDLAVGFLGPGHLGEGFW